MPEFTPPSHSLINNAFLERATSDTTPGGANQSNPSGFEGAESTTRAYGYHPKVSQMRIETDPAGGIGDVLYCHYAPTDFSENYVANYASVPIDGPDTTPVQYEYGNPKKWAMKLLFNDLGAPANRPSNVRSAEESIKWLFSVMRPKGLGGSRAVASQAGGSKPPVLLVFLTAEWFRCVLAEMTIKRLAIHPTTRKTTRAEVDVTFVEFAESAT